MWHSIYFIKRGKVEVTWPSETPNFVNVIEHDNYFGELGLFLNSKLNYTVSAPRGIGSNDSNGSNGSNGSNDSNGRAGALPQLEAQLHGERATGRVASEEATRGSIDTRWIRSNAMSAPSW